MNELKYKSFYTKYSKVKTEVEQYALLKDFTLSLSLDELLAWNKFISIKWQKKLDKSIKKGLTEDDKIWFNQQFEKFDTLVQSLNLNSSQA